MESKKDTCLTNEAVLIQSVVCSKKVKLIAHVNTCQERAHYSNIQFVPDLSTTHINGTLLKDLMVIQGHIKGNVIADGKCLKKANLIFQEEVMCKNICPGDTLKHTKPVLEGVLPPQIIPAVGHEPGRIVFKVILSIQATVIREKIGTINVQIIGDVNENRCDTPQHPAVIIPCENHIENCKDHVGDCKDHIEDKEHHYIHFEDKDLPCPCEKFENHSTNE